MGNRRWWQVTAKNYVKISFTNWTLRQPVIVVACSSRGNYPRVAKRVPAGRDWQVVPGKHGPLRFQMILECHHRLTGMSPFVVAMEEGRLRSLKTTRWWWWWWWWAQHPAVRSKSSYCSSQLSNRLVSAPSAVERWSQLYTTVTWLFFRSLLDTTSRKRANDVHKESQAFSQLDIQGYCPRTRDYLFNYVIVFYVFFFLLFFFFNCSELCFMGPGCLK